MRRLFKLILDLIIILFVITAIIETTFILMKDENGVTHFGDYITVPIKDDTMEPTIMTNDLILNKKVSTPESIKENDVISYLIEENEKKEIKTGRVVEINQDNGSISWKVKGDNQGEEEQITVTSDNIVGLFTNTKMLFVGGVLAFLETQNGFLICIIIPLLLIFFYQLCKLISTILKEKKENQKEVETENKVMEPKDISHESQKIEEEKQIEIPKEEPIKIETPKVEQPQKDIENSELDIPIVVTEPSFSTPNIGSIPVEQDLPIPDNTDINISSNQGNDPIGQKEEIESPKVEEEIEIL